MRQVGVPQAVEAMLKAFLGSPEFAERIKKKGLNPVDALQISDRLRVDGKKITHVVSFGTHCLTSSILKKWGLKQYSMPFDWIFMSPGAVAHCLQDDFRILMDQSFYGPSSLGPGKATHNWYREHYKIGSVFAHRDPRTENDYRYLVRSVERFRTLMADQDSAKLFIMISEAKHDVRKHFAHLSERLGKLTPHTAFICIHLTEHTGIPGCSSMNKLAQEGEHALYEFTPSSLQAGLGFPERLDDLAILRLIHKYDIDLSASV